MALRIAIIVQIVRGPKKLDAFVKISTFQDCCIEHYGGLWSRRCPDYAYKARQETNGQHKKTSTRRPLGSVDKCVFCGRDYIVASGRKKYCFYTCKRKGVLAWQRQHKRGYSKASVQDIKKQERRKRAKKICVYCLRPFASDTPTNTCPNYFHRDREKLIQRIADINRGYNRDHDRYIAARNEHMDKVKGIIIYNIII